MSFISDSYTLIALFVALLMFVFGIFVIYYQAFRGNPASIGLIMTAIIWISGMGLTQMDGEPLWQMIGFYTQYCGLTLLIPFLVVTSISFSRKRFAFQRVLTIGYAALGLAFVVLITVGNQLGLVFRQVQVSLANGIERQTGPLYPWFIFYLACGVFGGILIILLQMKGLALRDIRRSRNLIVAYLVPTMIVFAELIGFHPLGNQSLIPYSMLISVVFLAGGVVNGRVFSPVVTAHESLVDAMADPILVVDAHGRVVYGNHSFKALFPGGDFKLGSFLSELLPELSQDQSWDPSEDFVVTIQQSKFSVHLLPVDGQSQPEGQDSARLYVLHDVTSMMTARSELETQVRERTQRLEEEIERYRQAKLELEQTVNEKEVLLQELHHRVKNNLQIIISLLNLQSSRLDANASLPSIFLAMKSRIRSISLVHERMHQTRFEGGVDFGEYVVELVRGIANLYEQVPAELDLMVPVGKYRASMDFCVDFGLVVNELVTNAFKHGLSPTNGGTLGVELSNDAGFVHLWVRDSGAGFPPGGQSDSRSLGMNIVNSLCQKHYATVETSNNPGGQVQVSIPLGSEGISHLSLVSP